MTPSSGRGAGGPSERDERDRFDAWWDSQPHLHDIGATEYRHHARATAWASWQAASFSSPPTASAVREAAREVIEAFDEWDDRTLAVRYANLILKIDALRAALATAPKCPLCGDELEFDGEVDDGSEIPPAGAGVCSECFARWHDAPVLRERLKATPATAPTLDVETIEVCARVCEERVESRFFPGNLGSRSARRCAAAIRALLPASRTDAPPKAAACPTKPESALPIDIDAAIGDAHEASWWYGYAQGSTGHGWNEKSVEERKAKCNEAQTRLYAAIRRHIDAPPAAQGGNDA